MSIDTITSYSKVTLTDTSTSGTAVTASYLNNLSQTLESVVSTANKLIPVDILVTSDKGKHNVQLTQRAENFEFVIIEVASNLGCTSCVMLKPGSTASYTVSNVDSGTTWFTIGAVHATGYMAGITWQLNMPITAFKFESGNNSSDGTVQSVTGLYKA